MEKTLMPADDDTVAPDDVSSRFTNRDENANLAQLQCVPREHVTSPTLELLLPSHALCLVLCSCPRSKFVSKEVYKVADNLYQDETTAKPYIGDTHRGGSVATQDMTDIIAEKGLSRKRNELEAAEAMRGHDGRTLYEQLAANRDAKDEQWKKDNNPFMPNRAYDDDELEFIENLQEQARQAQQSKKVEKEQAKAAFAAAQAQRELNALNATKHQHVAAAAGQSLFAKAAGLSKKRPATQQLTGMVASKRPQRPAKPVAVTAAPSTTAAISAQPTKSAAALTGLTGYGSDSSSDSD
jgi:hypothetical protein